MAKGKAKAKAAASSIRKLPARKSKGKAKAPAEKAEPKPSQERPDQLMIRDVESGIRGDPVTYVTRLVKIDTDKKDEYRWCAWYILRSTDVWVNRNLKKMTVPAVKFKMALLDEEESPYEIVADPSRWASLPYPAPEVRMV